jgi:hypothetical protein
MLDHVGCVRFMQIQEIIVENNSGKYYEHSFKKAIVKYILPTHLFLICSFRMKPLRYQRIFCGYTEEKTFKKEESYSACVEQNSLSRASVGYCPISGEISIGLSM